MSTILTVAAFLVCIAGLFGSIHVGNRAFAARPPDPLGPLFFIAAAAFGLAAALVLVGTILRMLGA
ncbi:hypothetical protein [Rhodoplanes roseus]|uniref:hypothetical protein n=1 Tax=Rhodoplanes roseus TaxID=29409 RepID=UPI0011B625AA|nr:hypothetical protein [Rhodoplanes roseus]